MFQAINSPLLLPVGIAVSLSFLYYAVLWLLYVVLSRLFPHNERLKYKLGVVFQITGFCISLYSLFYYKIAYNTYQAISESFIETTLVSAYAFVPGNLSLTYNILPSIAILYFTGLLIMSVRWIISLRNTNVLYSKNLVEIDEKWKKFIKKYSGTFRLKKEVSIYISSLAKSPLTIGTIRPIILIPATCITGLSAYQIESLILHELWHIKRGDYLVNVFLSIIETLLFFNPFVQLLGSQIRQERELCCDEQVLQSKYDAVQYATALLQIARAGTRQSQFAMNAGENNKLLLYRIRRILCNDVKLSPVFPSFLLPSFALLAFAILGWINIITQNNIEHQHGQLMKSNDRNAIFFEVNDNTIEAYSIEGSELVSGKKPRIIDDKRIELLTKTLQDYVVTNPEDSKNVHYKVDLGHSIPDASIADEITVNRTATNSLQVSYNVENNFEEADENVGQEQLFKDGFAKLAELKQDLEMIEEIQININNDSISNHPIEIDQLKKELDRSKWLIENDIENQTVLLNNIVTDVIEKKSLTSNLLNSTYTLKLEPLIKLWSKKNNDTLNYKVIINNKRKELIF